MNVPILTQDLKAKKSARKKASNFWKKQARIWHWISGAICLIGMLLFAVTGITLNHAADIKTTPKISNAAVTSDEAMMGSVRALPLEGESVLPKDLVRYLRRELNVNTAGRSAELTDIDIYVGLPRAGGDAWLAIDRETGLVEYESTSRGAISYLNDLHKGRNTGTVWAVFLDVFSIATIFFCLTGLWLLQIHSKKRAITWPLTIGGLAVPVVILFFFAHG
ncbi:PepSY-associated TM helix domain-containing protein [Hirschia baltica]|uniref:PepSY-associated TM helix domain protein n=1 Tax=Hirschia baltica (strain ATCC 49814 / DSM 5838 / IFAM 1418) TaxID=582402 RepID=C6XM31_HIRBI|nr:PepSY-associated TM helix domain-containing protein [Hirschia baltica]ACT59863.1 PepSY-associated TM helix domain protein [Hirschia baltica ATCC 49814]